MLTYESSIGSSPPIAGRSAATALVAGALVLAPALGATGPEVLQNTLKLAIWSLAATGALLAMAWNMRSAGTFCTHPILAAPLALAAFAAASAAWGNATFAIGEAGRWLLFALIAWLCINVATPSRLRILTGATYAGAAIASLWTVLQFTSGWSFFAQGEAHPASTFANRNVFAEYAVCALPFGLLLLRTITPGLRAGAIAASMGLIVAAVMMTAMRTALLALVLQAVVLPVLAWRHWVIWPRWSRAQTVGAAAAFLVTVGALGMLPCADNNMLAEKPGSTAFERVLQRATSTNSQDESIGVRKQMWLASARMIAAHPLIGVGAGSWGANSPVYMDGDPLVELDQHAHNEYLQLAAEYGLPAALLFVAALGIWLARTAVDTWRSPGSLGATRSAAIASTGTLLFVSITGFAWHQAGTAALLAICLGIVACTERKGVFNLVTRHVRASWRSPAMLAAVVALAAAVISLQQAMLSEAKLVRAYRLAMYLNEEPAAPHDPAWQLSTQAVRQEIGRLAREAAAIDAHNRRVAPLLAEEMARYGAWDEALTLWKGVLEAYPYVPAILVNAARASAALEQRDEAWCYLDRAHAVAPRAPAVLSLRVALLADSEHYAEALIAARSALDAQRADLDLLSSTIVLSELQGDKALRDRAAALARKRDPKAVADAYLQLGALYHRRKAPEKAAAAWFTALHSQPSEHTKRAALLLLAQSAGNTSVPTRNAP